MVAKAVVGISAFDSLMPVASLNSYNMLDVMRPDQKVGKLEEGNDTLDTFIRQAIGKEPVLSFSRAGDNPVQWIQLLQALDHQDLPGWPLLSPPKVQLQKCDKCSREFCSPINYRRHKRVHRRALKVDKDFPKNRDLLGAFWDKLSLDEAKEIVSFKNITLEEVSGSSIVKTLTSLIRKPGFFPLPQVYIRAGSALLDVVQARSSRFPISSQELFNILDDASEKTFLCAGTALSLQKFVFDGEAGKIGLEMKNIVACTCFLVEQKLVNAWLADKDAEALRCHKLLVEEEEAAQRRQADLLERRRLKKLRKENQRVKEQVDREEADLEENSSDSLPDLLSVEASSLPAASNSNLNTLEEPSDLEPLHPLICNKEADASCFSGLDNVQMDTTSSNADVNNFRNVDRRLKQGSMRWNHNVVRRPSPSSRRGASNGFHSGAVVPKLGPVQRQGVHRDQKSTLLNGYKIWTRKTKPDKEGEDLSVGLLGESRDLNDRDSIDHSDVDEKCEVLIGSISVTLRECNGQSQGAMLASPVDQCTAENQLSQNKCIQKNHAKPDSGQCGVNRSVKLWRPVGKHEAAGAPMLKDGEDTVMAIPLKMSDRTSRNEMSPLVEECVDPRGPKLFCCRSAEAFLTQRWKKAIAADHVKLVLSSESEPPNPNILCSSENRLSRIGPLEPAIHGATKLFMFFG
ncbi:C2h2-like zinc finger protein [Thalictrum thalictroides]|uniref:C2h2-like zinc finger protein n=1 Tax=Thalictrum thalictroides TaxID=46969 RepID=A0A7J6XFN2_THATH|nr:C2h2-like zinc finger protein [Thalictrum thalictroides]